MIKPAINPAFAPSAVDSSIIDTVHPINEDEFLNRAHSKIAKGVTAMDAMTAHAGTKIRAGATMGITTRSIVANIMKKSFLRFEIYNLLGYQVFIII